MCLGTVHMSRGSKRGSIPVILRLQQQRDHFIGADEDIRRSKSPRKKLIKKSRLQGFQILIKEKQNLVLKVG